MPTLEEIIDTLEIDSGLMHSVVHGSAIEMVSTEGGDIKTLAGALLQLTGFVIRGNYAVSTAYSTLDLVIDAADTGGFGTGIIYLALEAFTSGDGSGGNTLADEIAAGKWVIHQGLTPVTLPQYATLSTVQYSTLRAINTVVMADGAQVQVSERSIVGDGGGGSFTWNSADLSAEVTADTASGLYIAPDSDLTGASGAWARNYVGALNPCWFGLKGDGSNEYAELAATLSAGDFIIFPAGMAITYSTTLTIEDKAVDFNGATLTYTGAVNTFGIVSTVSSGDYKFGVKNFTLVSSSTDTTNRTHGLNIGGTAGYARNYKIEGFTGISFALGSGSESYTGVTLPTTIQAYYNDISNVNIASTSGWNLVIKASNNANSFRNFSTFPYNGFDESPTRSANAIHEMVIGGTANHFDRVSLEASPSSEKLLLLATANANVISGPLYLEYNTLWATPPFPRITAQAQSSANQLEHIRHPYNGDTINDLGTANKIVIDTSFYINGQQQKIFTSSPNMIVNGDFDGDSSANWSDWSTGQTATFGTGYFKGSSWRLDLVAGRPNVAQDLIAIGGINASALHGQNVTIGAWVRTDLPALQVRFGNLSQGEIIDDGAWHYVSSTVKVTSGDPLNVQFITDGSDLTGFMEISNVTATVGLMALAF